MVQCFAPDCNHQSERETCKFFRFPKDLSELNWWKKALKVSIFWHSLRTTLWRDEQDEL